MKKHLKAQLAQINRSAVKIGASASALLASSLTFAAVDITKVESGITAAQTSGESVGALVVGAVAALVVVGIIIGLVKKI